jgi:hypothetical protein
MNEEPLIPVNSTVTCEKCNKPGVPLTDEKVPCCWQGCLGSACFGIIGKAIKGERSLNSHLLNRPILQYQEFLGCVCCTMCMCRLLEKIQAPFSPNQRFRMCAILVKLNVVVRKCKLVWDYFYWPFHKP